MTELLLDRVASPIGTLPIVVDGARLCLLDLHDDEASVARSLAARYGTYRLREAGDPAGVASALRAYFAGDLTALDGVEVDTGGTEFQRAVWRALREIPAGTTETYGALARRLGKPDAARAVGITNGLNPVAIVVPCHRVIGANGSLTGFGGGLPRKQWLLEHEGLHFRNGVKVAPSAQLAFGLAL